MFEDYFGPHRSVPQEVYTIMQFLDYSFYEIHREYFTNVDKYLSGRPRRFEVDKIMYADFIETFKLIFDV